MSNFTSPNSTSDTLLLDIKLFLKCYCLLILLSSEILFSNNLKNPQDIISYIIHRIFYKFIYNLLDIANSSGKIDKCRIYEYDIYFNYLLELKFLQYLSKHIHVLIKFDAENICLKGILPVQEKIRNITY